mmetsp:Transcript_9631/g.18880  ORF Transcript_9631/g.18880 Transcript_9631/m.18880 type:complete len:247 (-) Transcript_9631:974-1714(-)
MDDWYRLTRRSSSLGAFPAYAESFSAAWSSHDRTSDLLLSCSIASHRLRRTASCLCFVDMCPYSPRTHAMTLRSTSGTFGFVIRSTYVSTAKTRILFGSVTSTSSLEMSVIRLCAISGRTRSPPSSNTVVIVSMYHLLSGANFSAIWVMRETNSERKKGSTVWRRKVMSFCMMTRTFWGLVMLYSRSRVLRRSVSSGSSRQSITVSWCFTACLASICTIPASALIPRYLRLWLSAVRKRDMELAAS